MFSKQFYKQMELFEDMHRILLHVTQVKTLYKAMLWLTNVWKISFLW